jgi:hypothetical protein
MAEEPDWGARVSFKLSVSANLVNKGGLPLLLNPRALK